MIWIVATVVAGAFGGVLGHEAHIGHGFGHGGHDFGHGGHGLGHGGHDIGHGGHSVAHGSGAESSHAGNVHGHAQPGESSQNSNSTSKIIDTHVPHVGTSAFGVICWILGIDQLPITLVVGAFLFCWGSFGIMINTMFDAIAKYPTVYIWPSMGFTFMLSFAITRSMVAIIARMMPPMENYAVSRYQLVGLLGKAVFKMSPTSGTIDIADQYGTVHRVQAKTEVGKDTLERGASVIVIDFDENDKRYIVRSSSI